MFGTGHNVSTQVPQQVETPPDSLAALGVSKRYASKRGEVQALTDTDLVLEPGRFITIVGPSGCGKSTLLMILAGLLTPTTGAVHYDGKRIAGPQREVGVVFQTPALLPWLTVRQNAALPGRLGRQGERTPRRDRRERASELLRMVGLSGFEDRYPTELSGGMQQRAAIARSLLLDPPVLLMDEPFGALDALTRERMNQWLADIWQEQQKAVALVTHSIDEAVYLADEIVVMSPRPGRIVERVTVDLPRPRVPDLMKTPEFGKLAAHIRGLLDQWDDPAAVAAASSSVNASSSKERAL
jgi:NitT/TauT family transport system ATP-binding protein